MDQQFEADTFDRDDLITSEGHEAEPGRSWFATARGIMQHPVIGEDAPTPKAADPKRRAWTYAEAWLFGLVENAAFRRHTKRDVDGSEKLLDAGQLLASRRYLARKFNWSESAVRVFLGKLSKAGMIALSAQPTPPPFRSQGRSQGSNVLTVCNYGKYQGGAKARSQGYSQPPAKSQPKENNKTKQTSLTLRGGRRSEGGFDVRKESKRQRIAKPSTDSQLHPWQNPEGLALQERAMPGSVASYVRRTVLTYNGWHSPILGSAPGMGEENAYFAFLTDDELARWAPKFDEVDAPVDDALPENVVKFAPYARREFEGATL